MPLTSVDTKLKNYNANLLVVLETHFWVIRKHTHAYIESMPMHILKQKITIDTSRISRYTFEPTPIQFYSNIKHPLAGKLSSSSYSANDVDYNLSLPGMRKTVK